MAACLTVARRSYDAMASATVHCARQASGAPRGANSVAAGAFRECRERTLAGDSRHPHSNAAFKANVNPRGGHRKRKVYHQSPIEARRFRNHRSHGGGDYVRTPRILPVGD